MTWNLYEHGISYSSLCKFLICRERFRIYKIEGLVEDDGWNHKMNYGTFMHNGSEGFRKQGKQGQEDAISKLQVAWMNEYPESQQDICLYASLAKYQCEQWRKYYGNDKKKYFAFETRFFEKFKLPSGRVVPIEGYTDALCVKKSGISIYDMKVKGRIDEYQLEHQLKYDAQMMIYSLCVQKRLKRKPVQGKDKVTGIIYDVVRRPEVGYKLRRKKDESLASYVKRFKEHIRENPDYYFIRKEVPVLQSHLLHFKKFCLFPILEQLADWYDTMSAVNFSTKEFCKEHFIRPFGIYDSEEFTGRMDYFNYVMTGSKYKLKPKPKMER